MSDLLESALRVENKLATTRDSFSEMCAIVRRLTLPLSRVHRELVAEALHNLDQNFSTARFQAGVAALKKLERLVTGNA